MIFNSFSFWIKILVISTLTSILFSWTQILSLYQLQKHNITGGTTRSYVQYAKGIEFYKNSIFTAEKGWYEFRNRIGSSWLAGCIVANSIQDNNLNVQKYQQQVATWTIMWFLACCLIWVYTEPKWWWLYIVATFGAIMFATITPPAKMHLLSWDLPALFGFVTAISLYKYKYYKSLILFIICWIPMKETILVTSFLLLFMQTSWIKRISYFLLAFLIGLLIKTLCAYIAMCPLSYTMSCKFMTNVQTLFLTNNSGVSWWNTLLFANCGLFIFTYFVKPIEYLVIALLFTFGIFWGGFIEEYRIWYELIPLSVMGVIPFIERYMLTLHQNNL